MEALTAVQGFLLGIAVGLAAGHLATIALQRKIDLYRGLVIVFVMLNLLTFGLYYNEIKCLNNQDKGFRSDISQITRAGIRSDAAQIELLKVVGNPEVSREDRVAALSVYGKSVKELKEARETLLKHAEREGC